MLAVDALGRLEQAAGASAWEGDGGGAAAPPVTSDEVVAAPEKWQRRRSDTVLSSPLAILSIFLTRDWDRTIFSND